MSTYRSVLWSRLVQAHDPDFWRETTKPVAYEFSNGRQFREFPHSGVYSTNTGTST